MLCAARAARIHKTAGPPLAGVAVACADDDTAPEAVTCDEVRRHGAARSCYAWLVREIVFKHVTALGHVVPAPGHAKRRGVELGRQHRGCRRIQRHSEGRRVAAVSRGKRHDAARPSTVIAEDADAVAW